jgi:peptidoglycan/LPS O-acetylase OafA/YrhL|tara:strand:- start:23581 stop:24720 length:1140 start_codon:yes stop_codon:yes gene_type:complete
MVGAPNRQKAVGQAEAPQTIDPGLSVSLDIIRFLAALVVCVGHASGGWLTGGYFWQAGIYLHAAVMIFFVLSGYVVAATTQRARGGSAYSAARISRLLSVVIPALAVTALLDSIGLWANAEFYLVTAPQATGGGTDLTTAPAWRYLINLLHIQEFWTVSGPRTPGSNGPFWSLSYEAAYYAMFGMLVFLRPKLAWAGIALLLLAAGPRIALLAPIWFAGVVLWQQRPRISPFRGAVCLLGGIALAIAYAALKPWIAGIDQGMSYGPLLREYWAGLFTILIIAGVGALSHYWRPSDRIVRRIRTVADHTFELYLVHIPTVYFIAAISPAPAGSIARLVHVYGAVIFVTIATHRVGRRLRPAIRRALSRRVIHPHIGAAPG